MNLVIEPILRSLRRGALETRILSPRQESENGRKNRAEFRGFKRAAIQGGGNSAALAYVRIVTITMIMFAEDSANKTFSLETATPAQMRELVACSVGWNVRDGDIWVATKPLRLEVNDEPQIVAVCSRPFRNVPQYMIRQAPPRHAVAFSDGSTALISAGGFEVLDRSSFMPVNKVVSAPK